MSYRRRIIDTVLDELFPHLAAIALEGAKGVGKTATASQRAITTFSLDNPGHHAAVVRDWDLVTRVEPPVLIDEWQLEPSVWDRVRRAVDEDSSGGRFLLAGSALVSPGTRIHSGAGRIVSMKMRPLSFHERALEQPTVSLSDLLDDSSCEIRGATNLDLPVYVEEILRSGFPGIRDLPEGPRQAQLDSYIARIVERELPENGFTVRRPDAMRSWLSAYAAATSTNASYTTILDAATAGDSDKPTRQTVSVYREQLKRLFVLDPVDAWTAIFSPLKRRTHTPKHHLVDPALAARLANVERPALIVGDDKVAAGGAGTWLGALFESLVTQSVRVYAEATNASVGHLRTFNGSREVDLVIERNDRACVAIEVKLGGVIDDRDVRHLHWLQEQIGERLVNKVVICTAPYAYRRADGVAVIPLALLGP